jgi:hypothetical protein
MKVEDLAASTQRLRARLGAFVVASSPPADGPPRWSEGLGAALQAADGDDRVIHLPIGAEQGDVGAPLDEGQDWSETLEAVHRASNTLLAREERVRDLETELREVSERSSQAIEQLHAQIAELEHELGRSEARRTAAETWLLRLHEAIRDRLGPTVDETDGQATELAG